MADLELNENDSSLDTNKLPSSGSTFTRVLAGLLTTVVLYSGSILGLQTRKVNDSSNNANIIDVFK